ncbi:MAG TPA: hypothetical protein DCE08_01285 [Ruminococcaceae bacterium]|nr:hypothetical protein [Oscillospiraceae bacterium]
MEKIVCDPTREELRTGVWGVFKQKVMLKIIVFSVCFLFMSAMLFMTDGVFYLTLAIICLVFAVLFPAVRVFGQLSLIRKAAPFTLTPKEKGFEVACDGETYFEPYLSCEAVRVKDNIVALVVDQAQIYCVPVRCLRDTDAFCKLCGSQDKK